MGAALETILVTVAALVVVRLLHANSSPYVQGLAIPSVLVLAALVPAWIGKREFPRMGLDLQHAGHAIRTVGKTCVCTFPIVFLGLWVLMRLSLPVPLQPTIPSGQSWFAWLLYQFLYVAVAEEIFFRGYVQANTMRFLSQWGVRIPDARVHPALDANSPSALVSSPVLTGGRGLRCLTALLISATVFALAHIVVQGQITSIFTFLPGLVLAWLFLRTGSLLAPILFHGLANISYAVMAMMLVPA
ncbi:MAG: CPBP family intramembrane metalloprotease [Planctomycetes bacterium]|jgi:membrane protease YdiL (CAAX protease family)|nr:CPBP family intramembrane metalloprotease [Planctomycetota bacterium]